MKLKKLVFVIILAIGFISSFAKADSEIYESAVEQTYLIELYSSEGCSSCPPADKWLASLKGHSKLWKTFIPLEFHVDYWNYLGWTDEFSRKQFTKRQRTHANQLKKRTVYTPGFIINGQEWRLGRQRVPQKLGADVGVLKATRLKNKDFKINFKPKNKMSSKLKVYATLMAHGLETKVKSGENAGETLKHEFVVVSLTHKDLKFSNNEYTAKLTLPEALKSKAKSYSVAFWVSEGNVLKPIQATGGPIKLKIN